MTRFRFRLQRLKQLREATEKEAAQKVARALGRLSETEQRRDDVIRHKEQVLVGLERHLAGGGPLDPEVIAIHHREVSRLERAEAAAEARLSEARGLLEAARRELARCRTDRKVLDSLEDRARKEHEDGERRREARLMDELALTLRRRRRS